MYVVVLLVDKSNYFWKKILAQRETLALCNPEVTETLREINIGVCMSIFNYVLYADFN